jgi:two-component system, LuxR family, response regulator FixJ
MMEDFDGAEKPAVFVVDDDPAVCRAISAGIVQVLGLPVHSYASAESFLADFDARRPGCLIVDIKMPGISGLELQAAIRERGGQLPVIVISGHAEVPTAVAAMRGGALIVLEKPFDMQQLEEHVRHALTIDARFRDSARRRELVEKRVALLTDREREVMELLVAGRSNKETSLVLGVSSATVDKHRWRIFEKMQVENVVELVRLVGDLKPPNR